VLEVELKIICFACNKWGYSAADLAGVSRLKYSPSVKLIRLRCTGRIDPKHLLFAINNGADGVMVVGWLPDQCEFKTGNYIAENHINFVKRILERRGIGGDRVNMYNCSGAEAVKFVKSVEDTVNKIEKLGLNPLKSIKIEVETKAKKTGKKVKTVNPLEWTLKWKQIEVLLGHPCKGRGA